MVFQGSARLDGSEAFSLDHEAERRIARALGGQLEKALREVSGPEYTAGLEDARREVLDRADHPFDFFTSNVRPGCPLVPTL